MISLFAFYGGSSLGFGKESKRQTQVMHYSLLALENRRVSRAVNERLTPL